MKVGVLVAAVGTDSRIGSEGEGRNFRNIGVTTDDLQTRLTRSCEIHYFFKKKKSLPAV